MRRRSLLILFSFFFGTMIYAQSQSMRVYPDQKLYIAGEKIWLAGLIPCNEISAIVRAYLFDRAGNLVQKGRVMSINGKFSLSLQLEGNIASDHFLLAVSSNGFKPQFIPVTIINPVIPPRAKASENLAILPAGENPVIPPGTTSENQLVPSIPDPGDKHLTSGTVTINQKEYNKREEVVVESTASSESMLHISVSKLDNLSVYIDSVLDSWVNPGLSLVESNTGEGEQLMLRVYNAANEPASGIRVFASVLGDQANIATAITDAKGTAIISMPYVYGNASMVFSAAGAYRITYEESLVQLKGEAGLPALQVDERFQASLNQRLLNAEVTNKYRPDSKLAYISSALDTTDFYGKPDKRYMLDDYTRIPNMEEILYEYVQEARARKLGDKSVIYAFNTPFKTFFELPAMVLLDGVPLFDINQLLSMDPLQLKSVDVVARKFLLDDLQIQGIVQYKSYKSDMAGFKLPESDLVQLFQGLSIPTRPRFAPYGTESSAHLPDMRNLAYWSSFSEGRQWKFLAPDSEGEYLVRVLALDKNGNQSEERTVIRVK